MKSEHGTEGIGATRSVCPYCGLDAKSGPSAHANKTACIAALKAEAVALVEELYATRRDLGKCIDALGLIGGHGASGAARNICEDVLLNLKSTTGAENSQFARRARKTRESVAPYEQERIRHMEQHAGDIYGMQVGYGSVPPYSCDTHNNQGQRCPEIGTHALARDGKTFMLCKACYDRETEATEQQSPDANPPKG